MTGSAPTQAIAVKKAEAASNRRRIAEAIASLQRDNQPINVLAVARRADVHPDTVRRSGDLYAEVKHLRDQQWSTGHAQIRRTSASDQGPDLTAMRVRLTAAQEEVVELRRELATARKAAHQAMGSAGHILTPDEAARIEQESAELRVEVTRLDRDRRRAVDELQTVTAELQAAHEVIREYVRDLNSVRNELQRREQDLVALRRTKRRRTD